MDRVFGDLGLDVLGDVLDDPLARPVAALQRTTAIGADVTAMRLSSIDTLGLLSPGRLVSGFGPSPALACFLIGLGINRHLSRGRGGMRGLFLELGNSVRSGQNRQLNGFGAESGQLQRLRFRARPV